MRELLAIPIVFVLAWLAGRYLLLPALEWWLLCMVVGLILVIPLFVFHRLSRFPFKIRALRRAGASWSEIIQAVVGIQPRDY